MSGGFRIRKAKPYQIGYKRGRLSTTTPSLRVTDAYREGAARMGWNLGENSAVRDEFCPTCERIPAWCECVPIPDHLVKALNAAARNIDARGMREGDYIFGTVTDPTGRNPESNRRPMAEATEATVTTTETIPATTEAPTPVVQADLPADKPAKLPSAMERVEAALAKAGASKEDVAAKVEKPADDKDAKVDDKAKPDAKADDDAKAKAAKDAEEAAAKAKADEEKAKTETRLSRATAILAERETAIRNQAKALETEKATWEKQRGAEAADLDFVRKVRTAYAEGGDLAAVKALGIDLKKAVDMMSREIEPSAEDVQRKIVREELEARERKASEAAEKAKTEAAERAKADQSVKNTEFWDKVCTLDASAYPFTVARQVSAEQTFDMRDRMTGELGRAPSHVEVMDRIEKILIAQAETESNSASRQPAVIPSTVTPPPAAEKPVEAAKPKAPEKREEPAKQQGRRQSKRETASDRAEAALKRLNIH